MMTPVRRLLAFVIAVAAPGCGGSIDASGAVADASTDADASFDDAERGEAADGPDASPVSDATPEIRTGPEASTTPDPANLGARCREDAECSKGLVCLRTTGYALYGGGPAGGYCSRTCTDALEGDPESDPCKALGGECVAVTAPFGERTAVCLRGCVTSEGSRSFSEDKCHGRSDVGCTPVSALSGTATVCLPTCSRDADCGSSGRRCDPRTGMCVDAANQGDPTGASCAGTSSRTCAGYCIAVRRDGGGLGYVCASRCVLGDEDACGFRASAIDAGATPVGFCRLAPAGHGVGDSGSCGQLCDTDVDCANQSDGGYCSQSAANLARFGHGVCALR